MKNIQIKTVFLVVCMVTMQMVTSVKAESNPEEVKEMLKNMAEECIQKTSASEAELDNIVNKKPAIGREGKCLKSCIMMQFEIMEEGTGEFLESGSEKIISMMAGDNEERLKSGREIHQICVENVKDEKDLCEKAEKYTLCVEDEGQKRGLKVD